MNHILASLWVTVLLRSSEWLNSKASLWKTRKASRDQKEILACTLENDCSKTVKAERERLCRRPVLEMLPRNFIKTGFHRWHSSKNVPPFFGPAFSQNIDERLIGMGVHLFSKTNYIASARQLSKCNKRSTVIAFITLVKFHKSLEGTKPFVLGII